MRRLEQLTLALVFLTRLPLARFLPPRLMSLAHSTWAFPLAGALIGAISALPLMLGVTGFLGAALCVTIAVWLTAALHEDALADFADAAGGQDRDARLTIMRDSRIGSFGVMALMLTTVLRIAAVTTLSPLHLIAAAAGGRAAIVLTMGALVPARADGLAAAAGAPGWKNVGAAAILGAGVILIAGEGAGLALIAGLAATALVIRQARIWLGGQTGDVLGAASVLAETAILTAFALILQG